MCLTCDDTKKVLNTVLGWMNCPDCDDGKPADTRECDCCGQMKPGVTTVHIPCVGDTSACADCRNPVQ